MKPLSFCPLLLSLLLPCVPLEASNAFVQAKNGAWSSGTSFTASAITYGAGDLAVVGVMLSSADAANDISSISDTINTYTQIDKCLNNEASGIHFTIATYYAKNVTAGAATITVNLATSTLNSASIVVMEYSGADTSTPLDQHHCDHQLNPGPGTDAVTTSSVTTTTNGQAVCGFLFEDRGGSITLTAGTGYTQRSLVSNQMFGEDQIQTSAGAITATGTLSFSDSVTGTWMAIATFKAATAGGSARHSLTTLHVGH